MPGSPARKPTAIRAASRRTLARARGRLRRARRPRVRQEEEEQEKDRHGSDSDSEDEDEKKTKKKSLPPLPERLKPTSEVPLTESLREVVSDGGVRKNHQYYDITAGPVGQLANQHAAELFLLTFKWNYLKLSAFDRYNDFVEKVYSCLHNSKEEDYIVLAEALTELFAGPNKDLGVPVCFVESAKTSKLRMNWTMTLGEKGNLFMRKLMEVEESVESGRMNIQQFITYTEKLLWAVAVAKLTNVPNFLHKIYGKVKKPLLPHPTMDPATLKKLPQCLQHIFKAASTSWPRSPSTTWMAIV